MNQAVVITGSSSGIGRATALHFAKNNFYVFLLGRNIERLQSVANEIKPLSHKLNSCIINIDLEDLDSITKAINEITKHLNDQSLELTSLINCAGEFSKKSFVDSHFDDWTKMMKTNVIGPAELTRKLIPQLIKAKGSIVNVSSTLGVKPSANVSIYCATKAALNSWTQSLAIELGPQQVRVNAICPGLVDTPIHDFHFFEKEKKAAALAELNKLQPLGRIGQPEEIAKSIYFLASQDSGWTTGALLNVDGGINLL